MQKLIKSRILEKQGCLITYAEFIELALYHPKFGYYMKKGDKIGRAGDFITTSNFADIYGSLMARWFSRLVKEHNLPPSICEIGAGNGRFAKSFIDEWNKNEHFPINYFILEASPYHKELQQENIVFNEHVKQISSLDEIKSFQGLFFSNELFDALPVHIVQNKAGVLEEIMIGLEGDEFIEIPVPLTNTTVRDYLVEHKIDIKDGHRVEVCLDMAKLVNAISETMDRGIVVTVDYGYTDEEWQEPARREGSLRGYYKHKMLNNVLSHPGEMDITSHVRFDTLVKLGEKAGLENIAMVRQDEFFLGIGILEMLAENYDPNPFSEMGKRNRAIRNLVLPGGISSFFHVVLQQKGLQLSEKQLLNHKLD